MVKTLCMALSVEIFYLIMNNIMEYIDFFEAALFAACFGLNAGDFKGFPIEDKLDLI